MEENTVKAEPTNQEENAIKVEPTNPEEKKVWDEKAINEFMQEQVKALKTCFRVWIGVLAYLLIVGLVACLIVYGVLMVGMFVVNLIFLLKTHKFLKRLENGEVDVKELYEFYESMGRGDLKLFVLNILCGGLFGVIGTIYELHIGEKALRAGEEILGDDYKKERVSSDPNAKWHYCMYCKKNKREGYRLYKMTDGVICYDCAQKYVSMLPKRTSSPMDIKENGITAKFPVENALAKLSSKDLEDRLEYKKQNLEQYSNFAPTKVICDGCLELDETNSLFRIAEVKEDRYDSAKYGIPSGLVHPYSAVLGICYEMVYEYDDGTSDQSIGRWRYTNYNTIVFAIDDKYLKEEVFTLQIIPTKVFSNSKKPQIENAEQTVKELQEIFNKPVLPVRKLHA